MKLLGGLHPLVPVTWGKELSLHGLGCRSPPISLVGWAGTYRSGVTPFSSPLGLLLTHICYFFLALAFLVVVLRPPRHGVPLLVVSWWGGVTRQARAFASWIHKCIN